MIDTDTSYPLSTSRSAGMTAWLLLAASVAALSAGGWIYVVGRPNTYIYHLWKANIGPTQAVGMPEFVLYSLPNALWSLSSILVLHLLLRNEPSGRRLAVVSVVPMLGIISEIMQGAGWLGGVFDVWDLVCYVFPLACYLFYQSYNNFSNSKP